jgi:branched-chain amino acid transport system ATP-binding protein
MTVAPTNDVLPESVALSGRAINLVVDGHHILVDVSVDVAAGEFLAIIGPNGAGKTSLINVLSVATPPTSGRVYLHGRDVTGQAPHRVARSGLGRTFQTSNLFLGRSLLENARLAANGRDARLRTGFRRVQRDDPVTERARESLDLVGLGRRPERLASELSHGERRKLELAMVLAQGANVILLDEPMAGVSVDDVPELVELIRRVHREQGKTTVMVEHHMHVVLDLAERIGVMHHGAMIAIGPPDEIIANDVVQTAYMGEPL